MDKINEGNFLVKGDVLYLKKYRKALRWYGPMIVWLHVIGHTSFVVSQDLMGD
jgi:hypothetical protein